MDDSAFGVWMAVMGMGTVIFLLLMLMLRMRSPIW